MTGRLGAPMSRTLGAALRILGLLTILSPALALQPDEILQNPQLEARARAISAEIRCLVCQNQSIDDSDAPLARDLRLLVRERLTAGDSDTAVRDFVVRRYGEFVLLRPVFARHTLVLWLLPPLVVGVAGLGLFLARRRSPVAPPPALTEEEQARLRAALDP